MFFGVFIWHERERKKKEWLKLTKNHAKQRRKGCHVLGGRRYYSPMLNTMSFQHSLLFYLLRENILFCPKYTISFKLLIYLSKQHCFNLKRRVFFSKQSSKFVAFSSLVIGFFIFIQFQSCFLKFHLIESLILILQPNTFKMALQCWSCFQFIHWPFNLKF